MSDDTSQLKVDLFEGNQTIDPSADAGTTVSKDALADGKTIQPEPSKEEKPVDKAALQRQKQIDHWVDEITSGRKSLDDLPADKAWLKPGINQGLQVLNKEPDIDKIVEQKLAQKEAQNEFKGLQRLIQSMSLSKDKREILNEEYNENLSLGLADNIALKKAMKAAGISSDREDQERSILRQRMALPAQGTGRIDDREVRSSDPDFHKKVTDPKTKMKILMQDMRS